MDVCRRALSLIQKRGALARYDHDASSLSGMSEFEDVTDLAPRVGEPLPPTDDFSEKGTEIDFGDDDDEQISFDDDRSEKSAIAGKTVEPSDDGASVYIDDFEGSDVMEKSMASRHETMIEKSAPLIQVADDVALSKSMIFADDTVVEKFDSFQSSVENDIAEVESVTTLTDDDMTKQSTTSVGEASCYSDDFEDENASHPVILAHTAAPIASSHHASIAPSHHVSTCDSSVQTYEFVDQSVQASPVDHITPKFAYYLDLVPDDIAAQITTIIKRVRQSRAQLDNDYHSLLYRHYITMRDIDKQIRSNNAVAMSD